MEEEASRGSELHLLPSEGFSTPSLLIPWKRTIPDKCEPLEKP